MSVSFSMSQQTQKQKDAGTPTNNDRAYGTGQKKVEVAGFKTPGISGPEQTETPMKSDTAATKDATVAQENGVVDIPGAMNLTDTVADAKRDAKPNQESTLANES